MMTCSWHRLFSASLSTAEDPHSSASEESHAEALARSSPLSAPGRQDCWPSPHTSPKVETVVQGGELSPLVPTTDEQNLPDSQLHYAERTWSSCRQGRYLIALRRGRKSALVCSTPLPFAHSLPRPIRSCGSYVVEDSNFLLLGPAWQSTRRRKRLPREVYGLILAHGFAWRSFPTPSRLRSAEKTRQRPPRAMAASGSGSGGGSGSSSNRPMESRTGRTKQRE